MKPIKVTVEAIDGTVDVDENSAEVQVLIKGLTGFEVVAAIAAQINNIADISDLTTENVMKDLHRLLTEGGFSKEGNNE